MPRIRKIGDPESLEWEYRDNEFLNNNSFGTGWERFPKKTNKGESLLSNLEIYWRNMEEKHEHKGRKTTEN